jgi:hypothetical protein
MMAAVPQQQIPNVFCHLRNKLQLIPGCDCAGLTTLATLHMAAISPAKGWGAALKMLQGCSLQELVLLFADVCDGDMAGLSALSGLTHLDLHCSR